MHPGRIFLVAALLGSGLLRGAAAEEARGFVLLADERLEQSGLLGFLLPRFTLKHRIRPELETAPPDALTDARADLVLAHVEAVPGGHVVFHRDGAEPPEAYAVRLAPDGPADAKMFRDWIAGPVGQATIEAFAATGGIAYRPGAPEIATPAPAPVTGDTTRGARLALDHCGRCHVVGEINRMGGIGSTPSFGALRAIPGWEDKFRAFWAANPHPSFTQVDGITESFDPLSPPHIAPVEITSDELDAILAYAASIAPKDLGAPVGIR